MKKLIIAEKPSVAADIARVLGKAKKNEDFYENDEYVIASAVGHLVELMMPADIDKKYARWSLSNLPIIPEKFDLKPIEKTKKKLQALKKLMGRKDIECVINACDAGREGELIFTYIYEINKCKLPRKRLWVSSMTPSAISEAFENLRTQEQMASLQDAARCRSESDWLVGINATRAITSRMFGARNKNLASVGRVQTPTLSMIVEREHEIVFRFLHGAVKEGALYRREKPTLWICSQCGFRAVTREAWQLCPLCKAGQGYVEIALPFDNGSR